MVGEKLRECGIVQHRRALKRLRRRPVHGALPEPVGLGHRRVRESREDGEQEQQPRDRREAPAQGNAQLLGAGTGKLFSQCPLSLSVTATFSSPSACGMKRKPMTGLAASEMSASRSKTFTVPSVTVRDWM